MGSACQQSKSEKKKLPDAEAWANARVAGELLDAKGCPKEHKYAKGIQKLIVRGANRETFRTKHSPRPSPTEPLRQSYNLIHKKFTNSQSTATGGPHFQLEFLCGHALGTTSIGIINSNYISARPQTRVLLNTTGPHSPQNLKQRREG
jgi:hypothetical protein